ncbi:phosphoglucomutase/phosphomannomutase family protein [Caproiciproducens faecalis]|uniref:Phosphoglucomutase n=1 Tax=Caproiciproducens faecalis TaxID=2820301 RepID=A0ABS7DJ00_9FIRM|nr:phosphoglucomutase/phosphomannomutase family protein [Caproiciproducens faecalis]MBW7571267.1 phosphoglucomutase/phosphomannomutase family protein [Caproiciproducens faecalis]
MIKFGTGGWRAVIGEEFTKANVQLLTAAIAKKLKDQEKAAGGFVIGYDRRFLSQEAAKWAAEVMAGEGVPCRLIDRESPTPLIMFTVQYYGLPYGMAVTASHNPAIYNGIKVFMKGGRDADEVLTGQLEQYIKDIDPTEIKRIPFEDGVRNGMIELIDPMNQYIDSIIRSINMDAIRSRSLKIALDPMYGVSKTALQTILLTARCNVDVIHERRDALFGGRLPAPNSKTLAGLMNYVEENHCDIGIATDGDADRLGVINDRAEFLHPNKILVMLYYYLMKFKGWHGAAVRNIATTHLLDRIAEDFGETCYEVPVGFKYVSSKMAETNAIIGGESSGGLTVRGHIQGKDGIYAASLLVEMIATTGRGLSEIYKEITDQYGSCEMDERDFRFSQEVKEKITGILLHDKLLPEFPYEIEKVSYMDGCKVYFKNKGWIIARFSGTEPLLRIFCEMPTLKAAQETGDVFKQFLSLS